MKYSVTSGLLSKWPIAGGEANGSSGQPMLSKTEESKVYAHGDKDIVIEKKMAPVAAKTKGKRGLSMGPMVTSRWQAKGCSALAKEIVSLVGKSMGMPMATSGCFRPLIARVGQMKLEAPP